MRERGWKWQTEASSPISFPEQHKRFPSYPWSIPDSSWDQTLDFMAYREMHFSLSLMPSLHSINSHHSKHISCLSFHFIVQICNREIPFMGICWANFSELLDKSSLSVWREQNPFWGTIFRYQTQSNMQQFTFYSFQTSKNITLLVYQCITDILLGGPLLLWMSYQWFNAAHLTEGRDRERERHGERCLCMDIPGES